ncbi:MAG: ABC transporter permease [Tannerella sp.]|jgi:putative ABC transport system permease protein|nr:ABC transporter permease [Tannerella sp.]
MRSLLTCLGVFWGILMLVLLLGAGAGMRNGIFGLLEGFATRSVFFMSDRTSEPYKGFNKGRYWSMRNRDVENVRTNVEGALIVSGMVGAGRRDKNIVYGQTTGTYNVNGVSPDYFRLQIPRLIRGRLINDIDIRDKRKVCVIGNDVCKTLFRNEDPCGKSIRVNGIYYMVAGVIDSRANISLNGRMAESVYLPFTTLQQTSTQGDVIHVLFVSGKPNYPIKKMIDEVTAVLKAQNEIAPADPQAVRVLNLAAQVETFDMLFTGIDILVWLVGMGTLLAGVIGISNIMMVTVKERTKEIGVRRALGAKPFNIISQVMSESLLLTAMAGLLGLSLGVFLLDVVSKAMGGQPQGDGNFITNPEIHITTAVAATIILLLSGLLAGLIPAWRAMQINAIDAIREE